MRAALRVARRTILNWGVYAGTLAAALLVILAYQARPSYDVLIGGATDGPLLSGFNAGEQSQGANPFPFRWTTADSSITLRDVGRQDLQVTLSMGGTRPAGQPTASVQVLAGEHQVLSETLAPEIKDYTFHVPREDVQNGTLTLRVKSDAFSPPGDPRKLGIIVTHLHAQPGTAADRFIEPPPGPLQPVVAAALLLGLALAALGWGAGGAMLGPVLVGFLAAWLLVADRLWLTTARWYEAWPLALLAAVLVVGLAGLVLWWLLRHAGTPIAALQARLLFALVVVVFAVRLAGQMHPQILIVDLVFHSHRFDTVQSGQLLFTIKSAEWGGHETFYLPSAYIFMLPLRWLLSNEFFVIKLFTVAVGTLGALVLFYIGKVVARDGRAGLIAATLYLTVPLAVLPYSWGITTNLFGEFFALLALAALLVSVKSPGPRSPSFWVLLFALLVALLSHPGVVQLTAVAFTLISALWLLRRGIIGRGRAALWALVALALACLVAYVGYYSHFAAQMIDTFRQLQAERAQAGGGGFRAKIGGSVSDRSLGLVVRSVTSRSEWFFGGLRGFWQEAQAYYRVWPVAGAVLGYLFVLPASHNRDGRLRTLALAALGWGLTVVLFLVVGWVLNLYVRYALFALPIIALGAGLLLSGLWRRGRWGSWLAVFMLVFFAVEALSLWQYRITYSFK